MVNRINIHPSALRSKESPAVSIHATNAESGFGFSLIAIVVALVMGLTVTMVFRQVSTQSAELGDMYSASQAHWTAMSGIEWGIYKAELGENDVLGTFNFFNSTVTIDTSASDESGTPLTTNFYRVMSEGEFGEAESNFRIIAAFSLLTAWADVSIIEAHSVAKKGEIPFDLTKDFTLNDSIYFGDDVIVEDGSTYGDTAIGEATHIYYGATSPIGVDVETGDHEFLTYGAHPQGDLWLPDFDNSYYDNLIALADAVTSTSGNTIKGKKTWTNTTLDLSIYTDNTLYVKGEVKIEGSHVTGGTQESPGIIITNDKFTLKEAKVGKKKEEVKIQSTVDDNIIFISKKDIQLENASQFGEDHSALPAQDRPVTTNELYAKDDLKISRDVVAWGQLYCRDDIKLEGRVYGICLAPGKFTFEKNESYLEGAVFAHELNKSTLDNGQMHLNHIYHDEYFKIIDFGVEDNSLFEY